MITIKGIIGTGKSEVGLLSVIEQLQRESSSHVHVLIDSLGGDLDEAISVHNYLRNCGKEVKTECINNCASAASVIFIAGKIRIANCSIMIHNPYLEGVSGNSKELNALASFVKGKEQQLQALYAKHTKVDKATLANLMMHDTYMSPLQAVNLGFATEANHIAIAKLSNINQYKINETMSKETKSVANYLRELLGAKTKTEQTVVTNKLTLTTGTGEELQIERNEGLPQIGDKATPDGSHAMPDGTIIVVTDGVIVEILTTVNEQEEQKIQTMEDVAQYVEQLEKKVEDLEEQLRKSKTQQTQDAAILNAVKMAGGAEKVFAQFSGVYKPKYRVSAEEKTKTNALQERIKQLKGA